MAGFSLPDFGSFGSAIGSFGQAAGDLMTQSGYYRAANKYTEAGNLESANARIAKSSGEIQKLQQQRELYKVNSGTVAAAAGAGLSTSGSMKDILMGSTSQGALQQALTAAQTQINFNSHKAQSEAYYSEADQATSQGNAAGSRSGFDMMSGIAGVVGGLAPLALGFL